MMKNNSKYDVIVIGSGIGGLVCANYLALKGRRVLVFEKNREPGGYCTSLKRRGYTWDTAIHAIQNCGEGSVLNRILKELNLLSRIQFLRGDPTDTILSEDFKIDIRNDSRVTLKNFQHVFPAEANSLEKFFNLIVDKNLLDFYFKYRSSTFRSILDLHFKDEKLKAVFSIFLSNIGSLAENTSFLAGYALLKQFILFGGYYPRGGMQVIPDNLVNNIKMLGGEVCLNSEVDEIIMRSNKVEGVRLKSGKEFSSKFVASNADLSYTLSHLLRNGFAENPSTRKIFGYKPSLSIYIVFLALNKSLKTVIPSGPGLWYLPSDICIDARINTPSNKIMANRTIFCSFASKLDESLLPRGKDYMRIMVNTASHNSAFWAKNSVEFSDRLIAQVEKIIPKLSNHITCVGRATSVTMKNYTLNKDGAICGWLNSPEQINSPITRLLPQIHGLCFVGHWVTTRYGNGGVAMAAESGRKAASEILKQKV